MINAATETAAVNTLPSGQVPDPNDGMPQEEGMTYVSEFVAGLTDPEFQFLKQEVDARERGEMSSKMKSAEEVEFDLETEADRGSTLNRSSE